MAIGNGWVRRAALIGVLAVVVAGCGDDGSVLGASGSSTTSQVTSTSEGSPTSATTVASSTVPTTTTSTTTSSTTTTSTTTSTTTTTTTTVPVTPLEFLADGLNVADFGDDPTATIAAVRDYLGFNKTADSGWGPAWGDYGACPGTEYRQVEFQGLVLQFTDADRFQPAGTRHFFAWSYDGTPAGIAPSGVDVGMTVANLQALYPAAVFAFDDLYYGDVFRVEPGGQGVQLWGMMTGPNAGDTITYLTGGWGCGE